MRKNIILLIINTFLGISFVFTQEPNSEKVRVLAEMTAIFNDLTTNTGKDYYLKLDRLLNLEQELYKKTECTEYIGFVDDNKANKIISNVPDKEDLYKKLLKYQYDSAITVNNALYEIHKSLRNISKDTLLIQNLSSRMLDFQVARRPDRHSEVELKDSCVYYNQQGIEKLTRIAAKTYTATEKTAYVTWYLKSKNIERTINNELTRKYTYELYQIEPNKKKREKKKLEITPELVKEYYPELYWRMTDSLTKVYTAEGIKKLYRKDVSRFIYVLGKIYTETSIPALEAISMDTIKYSEEERYMAQIALARLGVQKYEDLFLNKAQPKAGELIYICSQASVYRFAELMRDTTKTTGCFPWIWEIVGKEYKDMKVSLAFKYLWMLDKTGIIDGFSAQFDYNYDDYCLFYASNTYSMKKEKALIENAINWLEENKSNYKLNPYAYDYGLKY